MLAIYHGHAMSSRHTQTVADDLQAGFRHWGELLPQCAVLVGSDGQWLAVNGACSRYAGLAERELLGWGWGRCVHPDALRRFMTDWVMACRSEHAHVLEVQLGHAASAHYLWHQARIQPLVGRGQSIPMRLVTFIDIQAWKHQQARDQNQISALLAANEHLLRESALYHAAQEQLQQTAERLNQVIQTQAALASAQLNLDEFIHQVAERILAISPATGAVVELLEGDEMVYRAASGTALPFKGVRLKVAASLSGECVRLGQVLVSEDTELDARVDRAACRQVGARSMVVTPLIELGEAIGVLKIFSNRARAFGDDDIKTVQMMAGLIAAAIDHQMSFDKTQELLQARTNALASLQAEMQRRQQVEAALAASAERTRNILESANDAFVAMDARGLITEWNNQAERVFGWTRDEAVGQRLSVLLIPASLRERHEVGLQHFLQTGQGPVINNRLELTALTKARGEIPVELVISTLHSEGAWSFYAFLHDISERKQATDQLRFQAQYDQLTGLPNRGLFLDRLVQAMNRHRRSHQWLALLYLDVDRFKSVNDTYGHGVGDALLKAFSQRIQGLIRASDTLARLGGDEFTLLAEELGDAGDADFIAGKIVAAMQVPFDLDGQIIQVGTSVGIALYRDADMLPQELVRRADTALYAAKAAGRNTFRRHGEG